jgi:hypothetical protein
MCADRPAFVPDEFAVPAGLAVDGFRLEPLGPEHNEPDYAAWTSSVEHIRATPGFRGKTWPDPSMTLDDNLGDLRRHAADFATRQGFTYTVIAAGTDSDIVGCVYIYPSAESRYDARVESWVRADRAELDGPLRAAVRAWLAAAWPFAAVRYDDWDSAEPG